MRKLSYLTGAFLLAFLLMATPALFPSPQPAQAETAITGLDSADSKPSETSNQTAVTLSKENDAAIADGADFALSSFSRAQVGSNRTADNGDYLGYCFYVGSQPGKLSLVQIGETIVCHVDATAAAKAGMNPENPTHQQLMKELLVALDNQNSKGGTDLTAEQPWVFTTDDTYTGKGFTVRFDVEMKSGQYHTVITGEDGSDISEAGSAGSKSDASLAIGFSDACQLIPASEANITPANTGIAVIGEFLGNIDMSPLWITLKTSVTAIIIVFFLGLLAAYFCMRLSTHAQDIADSLLTIPLVLPPTVCGFLLLLAFSRNTAIGQWFIDIGFPLVFSWQATVIAAVVVAFPLMYRSAKGAFESLDPNMLDAARTLGWSEAKIFFKLMLPLSWSSIAAGTVLAFARGLGEFGATLFLAGNYLGVTRTIPIAIYFEWMNGNIEVAIFWTIIIIIFSFIVILFINLWSRHTTRYRAKEGNR